MTATLTARVTCRACSTTHRVTLTPGFATLSTSTSNATVQVHVANEERVLLRLFLDGHRGPFEP